MECWLLCMLNAYTFYTFGIHYWLLTIVTVLHQLNGGQMVERLSIYHSAARWWIGWETLLQKFVLIWWGASSSSVFRILDRMEATWVRNYNVLTFILHWYKTPSLTLTCLKHSFEITQTLLDSARLSNINSIQWNWASMLVIYRAD